MSQELIVANQQTGSHAPFGPQGRALAAMGTANVGAVAIEQERAIAEAQGQMTLAKRFPRDLNAAHAELMIACKSAAFAGVAFYAKPQGSSTVSGPSIRMAEQIAQVFGNFQYGHRELSRDNKKSEVEIYAWDMEKNNYNKRQITVMHVRDTREGPKPLRDQADIDMKINNVASKQARGLILAMMPKWLVEDAVQECRKTLAGKNDEPIEARVRKMAQAFAKYGVTAERLEKHLGHKLDQTTLDELVDLTGIHNSLRDGTPASELFPLEQDDEGDNTKSAAAALAETAAKAAATQRPTAAARTAAAKEKAAPAAQEAAQAEAEAPTEAAAPAPETSKTAKNTGKKVNELAQAQEPQQEQEQAPDSDPPPAAEQDFF
jgi:hypothetical protein